MALNWHWDDKMGSAVCEKYGETYTLELFKGNAFTIAVCRYEENGERYYNMHWFAVNKDHMKNMLGLSKGYDNCFESFGVKSLWLNTKYKETAQFVEMLARAKMDITIHLYLEENV